MRIIHKTATGYELEHFDDEAREIKALFGTTTIPLPYTCEADPQVVRKDQEARTKQPVYLCGCAR